MSSVGVMVARVTSATSGIVPLLTTLVNGTA
jgi:hypothetical protein